MSSPEQTPRPSRKRGSGDDNGPSSVDPNDSDTKMSIEGKFEDAEPEVLDELFTEMFFDEERTYNALTEIDQAIDAYEERSGFRLIISKSAGSARTYKCGSHVDCRFRVKFGRIRGEDVIVLKKSVRNTFPYHTGPPAPPTAKGRAHKRRLKGKLEPLLDKILTTKDGLPRAKDVIDAAASEMESLVPTYSQTYRALQRVAATRREQEKKSFQMIIPYLQKFTTLNPGSTTRYEVDDDNNLNKVFVCPAIMQSSMRLVCPVMCLEATPLKSHWKGTLYVASVKTGCDDVYPVAISIMNEDENEADWNWFLEHLRSAIDVLAMDHPQERVSYKYFSFVSKCKNGLQEALENVFPQNYFCIEGVSPHASKSTCFTWLDDPGLPPRYGIIPSNWCEPVNIMFDLPTDGSWLCVLDEFLGKMLENISMSRDKHRGKTGVVQSTVDLLKKHWEDCAGFKIWEIHGNGEIFRVVRDGLSALGNSRSYNIDIINMTCECGEWQEHGVPCIDAMAYFRLRKQVSLEHVFAHHVDKNYTHENARELLRVGIMPVCMDHIVPDETTLPPKPPTIRASGPPKKQRIRKRSRFAHEPEKSTIVCSRCRQRGHNVRTCIAREAMAESVDNSVESESE